MSVADFFGKSSIQSTHYIAIAALCAGFVFGQNLYAQEAVSVLSYGAIADGLQTSAATNTTAFQAAQDQAKTLGNGAYVYIPAGTYVVGQILFDSGVGFLGEGLTTILVAKDELGVASSIFKPRTATTAFTENVYFKKMKLLGNSAGQHAGGPTTNASDTRHGIRLVACRNCLVQDVWAEDFDGDGVYMGNQVAGSGLRAEYNTIERVIVKNNVRNGMMIGTGVYNVIRNCTFESNQIGTLTTSAKYAPSMYASAELDLEPNASTEVCSDNSIESCTFLNGNYRAIQITRPIALEIARNRIVNNTFTNCYPAQIYMSADVIDSTLIRGNSFTASDPSQMKYHIRVCKSDNTMIIGNTFVGGCNGVSSSRAINIDQTVSGTIMTFNTFNFTGGSGDGSAIFTDATCTDSEIHSNTLLNGAHYDLRGTVAATYGFEAEYLSVSTSSGAVKTVCFDENASAEQYVNYASQAVGDFIAYPLTVPVAATYNVKVKAYCNASEGTATLLIDGVAQGCSMDFYSQDADYAEYDLGTYTFGSSGTHEFRFSVAGKNGSSSGYQMVLDRILLTKQ